MEKYDAALSAGKVLRRLIEENYGTQEDFACDFGADLRTVNRYVNKGIGKVSVVQEMAEFFGIAVTDFFAE